MAVIEWFQLGYLRERGVGGKNAQKDSQCNYTTARQRSADKQIRNVAAAN